MTEDGLADVERDATEEDGQEEDPLEVANKCRDQILLIVPHSEDCESDIPETIEDDDDGEVDSE